nr:GGDEF domain-containing protein [Roseburia sp. MSJ-14]
MFTLVFQQLLDALAKLENDRKIQKINAKLERSAVTDFLTGLYNRDGFFRNVETMLERSLKEKCSMDMALIYLDLDNFKYYNDTFGHDVGDIVLKEIAIILKKISRNNGFATRFGGDEFLVTIMSAQRETAQKTATQIMEKIKEAQYFIPMIEEFLGEEVVIPENKKVSCSMGIVLRENIREKQEFGDIIKEADKALYDIKRTTKNNYRFADEIN